MSKGSKGSNGSNGNNGITFTRNVPKFLKQYSSLLTINKKNYCNEQLGEIESYDSIEKITEEGATIVDVEAGIQPTSVIQNTEEHILVSDNPSKAINKALAENPTHLDKEEAADENGKILFKRKIRADSTGEIDKKKVRTKKNSDIKKSLLSFGDGDESS
mmetsp:Transcript_18379/g.18464  ORF Transcript_18379/g.18464 Transcript_18379/m.18464 type:complete len:160 (-) Transcript_18379:429-908(-)|eukprot:CAMPEP_0182419232 /NCGR_PEP_ID=MMETSP1167-20130531/3660_1 /TAXON_ID=2988 /ORGANISM="Mallomonas Sp, Strain CCMP3275" /LENGTH=159 /DNA_ID=CAMNT_0024593977 /DNA_START=33 /DNA_END=512 /DNA_ORIENTATION=+